MIEKLIGYTFKDKYLLTQALTHPSHSISDFQIFEFLGDRVLGVIIADILFKKIKNIKIMALEYSNLVNTEALCLIAEYWKISQYLKKDIETLSKKVLADAVEAIIAAIYLDSDFKTIYKIIEKLSNSILKNLTKNIDPKMFLQELAQAKLLPLPEYITIGVEGKEHRKKYIVQVVIEELGSEIGEGSSKHKASKIAAQKLMNKINEKN